jgi:hypothetical protein
VTQGLGVSFFIVFSAAYDIPLPSVAEATSFQSEGHEIFTTDHFSIWKARKNMNNKKLKFNMCRLADYSNRLKGCPEIHIWEPKPHSASPEQSHIMAAGLSAKRLAMFADNILRV